MKHIKRGNGTHFSSNQIDSIKKKMIENKASKQCPPRVKTDQLKLRKSPHKSKTKQELYRSYQQRSKAFCGDDARLDLKLTVVATSNQLS